mgnify:CR=1 FL=1
MSNIINDIRLSGVTYDIVDSTALHSLDDNVTSGGTNAVKGSGVYNAITAATGALAETIAEQGYQTSGDVQNAISGKANTSDVITNILTHNYEQAIGIHFFKNGVSNGVQVATLGTGLISPKASNEISIDTTVIAQKTDIPSVSGYADSVKYNSTSKYVEFYHGGTGGTKVFEYDASPFLIDGMVQNVEIKDVTISGESVTCLVISFNTDAGKQDINIPISEIFDASNYYTKTATDDAIEAATSGKADTSAVTESINAAVSGKADSSTVTGINDVLTAHTANTDVHVTTSDKSTWSGKQDALVSGTNIKTINGNSLLGSGDITVQTLPTVSGTTLIFS